MSLKIEEQKDLSQLNSFAVVARARAFVDIGNLEQLAQATHYAAERQLPLLVLGGGSNVLFAADYPGLVLHIGNTGMTCLEHIDAGPDQILVEAQAGQNWHELVMWCLKQKCYGIENLALIPGNVGAAPIQNIGAYGVELQDCFHCLRAWDLHQKRLLVMDREACGFGYRDSMFKSTARDRMVILSITLKLHRSPAIKIDYQGLKEELGSGERALKATPEQVAAAVCRIRRRKLPDPLSLPNAGSFFKNPTVSRDVYAQLASQFKEIPGFPAAKDDAVKIPAAWLLEQCGFKGKRLGRVGAHAEQPLVIVNYEGATGQDILDFSLSMQESVESRFALRLEPEVRIIC
ncbi:MAG: UDP-N-acetylmuramate dehydrogenase [Pseudohongiellaceae bacterium]